VQCLRGQHIVDQASCTIAPKVGFTQTRSSSSSLYLKIKPRTVSRGQTTRIAWNGGSAESCLLRARGLREEGVAGNIETPPLSVKGLHTFTLTCITESGEKTEVVETLTVK
jgi:hypothetical protein